MDLRTYPTRLVSEPAPFHCTVCVEVPGDEYVDIGPADILCRPCAERAASVLKSAEALPFSDAQTFTVDYSAPDALQCPDCERTFTRPAALGAHRRSHRVAV